MTMDDLDRRIRDAMDEVSGDLAREVDDAALPTLVADTLRGRMRFFVWISVLWSLVFFVLAVLCAVRGLRTDDLRLVVLYGVGTILCMNAVAMLKMWYFLQVETARQLRATKVAELRVLRAVEELRGSGA